MGGLQRRSGADPSGIGFAQPEWHLFAGGSSLVDDLAAAAAAEHDGTGRASTGAGLWGWPAAGM